MYAPKNILIPTDFSPAAWNAVQLGISLSENNASTLTLLHVFPSVAKYRSKNTKSNGTEEVLQNTRRDMERFSSTILLPENVKIKSLLIGGELQSAIKDHLKKADYDLIILGVNSTGDDNTPGSHISKIIKLAQAPVLIAPNTLQSAYQ